MNLSPFNTLSAVQARQSHPKSKSLLSEQLSFTVPNGFNANTNSSLFNAPPPVQSRQSKLKSKGLSSEQLSLRAQWIQH